MQTGQIPLIVVEAMSLPQAWEKMCLELWEHGAWIETQYDQEEEKPSLDCTGIVKVLNPLQQPRIHKNICIGYEDLEKYALELAFSKGQKDIEAYSYTYPDRFRVHFGIDQIERFVECAVDCYHSRRNQIITWDPKIDLGANDPPCLQRIWIRLLESDSGQLVLNMNSHWRSRDLWKAWFINAYGLIRLQSELVGLLTHELGQFVTAGRYVDISDSLHIYGRDQDPDEIKKMRTTGYLSRAISTSDPSVQSEIFAANTKFFLEQEKEKETEEKKEIKKREIKKEEIKEKETKKKKLEEKEIKERNEKMENEKIENEAETSKLGQKGEKDGKRKPKTTRKPRS